MVQPSNSAAGAEDVDIHKGSSDVPVAPTGTHTPPPESTSETLTPQIKNLQREIDAALKELNLKDYGELILKSSLTPALALTTTAGMIGLCVLTGSAFGIKGAIIGGIAGSLAALPIAYTFGLHKAISNFKESKLQKAFNKNANDKTHLTLINSELKRLKELQRATKKHKNIQNLVQQASKDFINYVKDRNDETKQKVDTDIKGLREAVEGNKLHDSKWKHRFKKAFYYFMTGQEYLDTAEKIEKYCKSIQTSMTSISSKTD